MSFVVTKVDGAQSFVITRTELTTGSGGGNVGPQGTVTAQVVGTTSTPLSVNFTNSTASVLEGENVAVTLRLNRALALASVIDVELSGTADPSRVSLSSSRVVFAADQLEATIELDTTGNAGGDPPLTAILTLVPTPSSELEGLIGLVSLGSQGAQAVTISIQDEVTGGTPPVWNFGVPGGVASATEDSMESYVLQLDKDAVVDQAFEISASPNSTATAVDFTGLPQTVTVPEGANQATFTITYPDNSASPPTSPILRIEGAALGNAQPGAVTEFAVTIEDNDVGSSSPVVVNWSRLTYDIPEGQVRFIQATLTQDGAPASFNTLVEIPLEGNFSTPEFSFDFGSSAPGVLMFAAGAEQFSFSVTAAENGTLATEDYTIPQAGATAPWRRGSRFRTELSSTLGVADPTTFMLPSSASSRRKMKALVAVDPPMSSGLPDYSLTTGERLQVVEFGKEANGAVSSVFVYGLTSGDESIARTPTALGIRPSLPTDENPVESGQFLDDSPTISFTVRAAGANFSVATAAALPANGEPTSTTEWTGPNGVWPQSGADLVRERVHLMRPLADGVTQSLLNKSPDTLGYIELCETKIAGDTDLVLFEGYWANGAWRSTDDPDVEALAVNPYTDGEVESMSSIVATALSTGDGDDWDITVADRHPAQAQGSNLSSIALLKTRAEPYFFPTCQPYTFWFAATRRGVAGAKERAEEYIRCRSIAWAVGDLGSTRQPIYGDTGDLTMDWGRAELQDAVTSTTGWRAIKELGEDQQDGLFSQTLGVIDDWTTGGVFPFSQTSERREGWHHPIYPSGGGLASGRGIYGSTAHLPWWTQWYRMRMEGHKVACRTRHFFRDVVTGRAPFWWELSEQAGLGQERTTAVSGSIASRTVRNRHWHFFGPSDPNSKAGPDNEVEQLRFAPLTRPWNTAPGSGGDPQKSRIIDYETFHNTHMPRERSANNDGWWGMRSFLSYRMMEARAASITRVHPPVRDSLAVTNFSSKESNLHGLLLAQGNHPEWERRGTTVHSDQIFSPGEVLRAYGWNMIAMGGFFSVAAPFERLALRGGPGIDVDWLKSYGEVMEFIAEDTGLLARAFGSNPEASSVPHFGPLDYCNRTGAFPYNDTDSSLACRPSGIASVSAPYGLGFHQIFCVRGAETMRRFVTEGSTIGLPDYLRRVLEWHGRYILGKDNVTLADGITTMPFAVLAAFDSTANPNLDGPLAGKATTTQLDNGELYWLSIRQDGSAGAQGWSQHRFKSGWTSVSAMRGLDDPGQAFIGKRVFDIATASDDEAVEYFMRGPDSPLQSLMTSANGGNRFSPLGDPSFIVPYVAELLNRIS